MELTIACDECGVWESSVSGMNPSVRAFRAELADDGWSVEMAGVPRRLRDLCPECSGVRVVAGTDGGGDLPCRECVKCGHKWCDCLGPADCPECYRLFGVGSAP